MAPPCPHSPAPLPLSHLVIRVGERPSHELHHPLAGRRHVPGVRQRHRRREADLKRDLEVIQESLDNFHIER